MAADAAALKAKGNAAFSAGHFAEAVEHFTAAIAADPANHVLYSNRSASHASMGSYAPALEDAKKTVELKPDWAKGYSRLGAAHYGLRHWDEAAEAYTKGLQLDPSNEQMKQGLQDARAAAANAAGSPAGPMGGLFTQPEVLSRLATNPQTRAFLGQPDFMQMLQDINRNPESMQRYLADERFQLALQVGLGMTVKEEEPSAAAAAGAGEDAAASRDGEAAPAAAAAAGGSSGPEPMQQDAAQPPAAEPEPEPERSEEEWELLNKKKEALQEKEAGNEAYKRKQFDQALAHYNRAIELYDQDISFLSNRAAVHFEKGDLEACIADCDEAVQRGRELRADYKLVARAMTRKGNALVKQGKLEEAIQVYQKSLTEHRNADTLKRLQETEKALKDAQQAAYINLDLSSEEKEKGNLAFKEQRYPEAVQHYTEALKRGPPSANPEAYKLYSNRAACYTKLGALNEGLKDAEECIRLAPEFAKGYSRKGHLQYFTKEYDKAIETYREGLKHDPENQELKEGLMRCVQAINKMNRGEMSEADLKERQARAMADPEVQSILSDPIMRQVLQDMQEDPKAAQQHLRHPDISRKIDKLVAAGILQIR
ncbi:hypothetical protein ABPG75_004182 [Micractinium tetrahymenae]